jgi:hypothetical protein
MLKKALLYIIGAVLMYVYMFTWDQILPYLAEDILKTGNPLAVGQFWLILTSPLTVIMMVALFLWIKRQVEQPNEESEYNRTTRQIYEADSKAKRQLDK